MDSSQFAMGGGAVGIISVAILIITRLIKVCNHKRLRSKCMDNEVVVSVDIESTTPPTKKPDIEMPTAEALPEPPPPPPIRKPIFFQVDN